MPDRARSFARPRRRPGRQEIQQRPPATGNTVLTIAWHLLSDPAVHYTDLGPAFYDSKAGRQRHARNLIRQLEHLTGKKVTLNEAA
jgi:transposase